jgi:hypothetical protein
MARIGTETAIPITASSIITVDLVVLEESYINVLIPWDRFVEGARERINKIVV